jgi:hypothetical protein
MQSLSLHSSAAKNSSTDLAQEIARLDALLSERRAELVALQEELHAFKARYTQTVGSRLAELAEVERAVMEAEKRALGIDAATGDQESEYAAADTDVSRALPGKTTLRKLFWSVARMFHPDHAADETEARRRHSIMAEANRAYQEGDVESLHTLLGDEDLRSYCASPVGSDAEEDLAGRLLNIREELRTVEFGIKRTRQDGLYRLKLSVDAEAAHGRDALAAQAERINRQITKARRRLEHLS